MLEFIISFILGYIIGSFPTAYIFVRKKSNIDIRSVGSGNVGTMNAFESTGSIPLATTIMIVDALKGIISIGVCWLILGDEFWTLGTGGIGAVIGHNYPVWLKFKGGRGLATTAGVMLVFGWIFVAVWCILWAILYLAMKNIHISNILASIASPIVLYVVPEYYLALTLPKFMEREDFFLIVIAVCFLILMRHTEFFNQILMSRSKLS